MSKHGRRNITLSKEQSYEIIRSPLITEKSTVISEYNQVIFRVPLSASKPEIRAAVESLFDVKVTSVNTLRQQGKLKRFRGRLGRRSESKKAIITLADGDSIDITTGV